MNQLKRHIALFFLLTIVWSSGGATVYSHFCKGANIAISSYVKIDHEQIEKECLKELAVQKSCHETEQGEPCCSDKVEFDTFEQVQPAIDQYVFLPVVSTVPVSFSLLSELVSPKTSVYFNKPPPKFESRKSFLFHQFLC